MKKFLSILLLIFSLSAFAQEAISEGVVNLKTKLSSTDSQMNSQFAMIGDINSVTYFKDNFTRTETSNVMTGNTVSILDGKTQEMLTYMDNPMGKMYMKKSFTPTEEDLKNMTIEKTDETKDILGYTCTKYLATVTKNGATTNMVIYSTNKISAVSNQVATFGSKLEGFPLLMTIEASQPGMNMTITIEVIEIKKESISLDIFDMTPPEGYTKTDNLMGM